MEDSKEEGVSGLIRKHQFGERNTQLQAEGCRQRKEPDVFREPGGLVSHRDQRGSSQRWCQGKGQRPVAHEEAAMSLSKRRWEGAQSQVGKRIICVSDKDS